MSVKNRASSVASTLGGIARLYQLLWAFAAGRRHLMICFLAMLGIAQVIRLTLPYFFGEAVNALQSQRAQDFPEAAIQIGWMVAACVAAWLLHGPGRVLEGFNAIAIRKKFADSLYAKAASLPLPWHEHNHSGETIQRINKSTQALFHFSQHQFIYLQNAISLVGPLIAIFLLSGITGAVAAAGYGAIALIMVRCDKTMVRLIRSENDKERRYAARLVDYLGNISTVLTLRLQEPTRQAVAQRMEELSEPQKRIVVVNEWKWCAIDLLNNGLRVGLVGLYAFLSWHENGLILVGTAIMVHQYSQAIGTVVGSMATHWQDVVRDATDIASADPILEEQSIAPPGEAGEIATWRTITASEISARHRKGSAPALDKATLTLVRGRRIALIGASGCGKSTMMRVLAGLYPTTGGEFLVDGNPRPGVQDLGGIGLLVPQEPEIFEESVRANLTLGLDYSSEEIAEACRVAQVQPVLDALPMGLDTMIVERGSNLSGGQRQRLALARGVLAARGKSLVMLDEPTSSLDPATERSVYTALFNAFPETCFVSSLHRLHLLPLFDEVVMMAQGRVVDVGAPDEIMTRHPGLVRAAGAVPEIFAKAS